jgi:hypothetical protein
MSARGVKTGMDDQVRRLIYGSLKLVKESLNAQTGTFFLEGTKTVEDQEILFRISCNYVHGEQYMVTCVINNKEIFLCAAERDSILENLNRIFSETTTIEMLLNQPGVKNLLLKKVGINLDFDQ